MDIETIGYFLYMSEQEQKQKDINVRSWEEKTISWESEPQQTQKSE